MMYWPWSSTRWMRAFTDSRSAAYCAFRSANGIGSGVRASLSIGNAVTGFSSGRRDRNPAVAEHIPVRRMRAHGLASALERQRQPLAVPAHPADLTRRNADDE